MSEMTRRDLMNLGLRGGLGALLAGSALGRLPAALADTAAAGATGKAAPRSVIWIYLQGGPSHIDTFDPKPGVDTGGPFKAIPTSVDGIRISEHLPRLAKQMKHLNLIRSMTSKEGSHDRARHLLEAGYSPAGPVRFPGFGAIVAHERTPKDFALPSYISIGGTTLGGGYLGARYSPFVIRQPDRPIANLERLAGVDAERFKRRKALLEGQEQEFARGRDNKLIAGHRETYDRSHAFMSSAHRKAFDLKSEPEKVRAAYGESRFGQSCLLARRLVEVGVPYVTVTLGGWDTHRENFPKVQSNSEILDQGLGTLVAELVDRGLLESTMILCNGEFGRTPRINPNAGRDHWPKAFSALVGGGGLATGQLIGKTDAKGGLVAADGVRPRDLFATLARRLGLDRNKVFYSDIGRPFRIVEKEANEVKGLL